MGCPFHNDKTPSFSIVDKGNGAFYKCFSCNEGGDIIKFIQKIEKLPFIQALQKAYEILNRPLNLPNVKTNTSNYLNKENLKNFYNDKYEKSLQEGDLDKAFELSCKADEITNKKYNIAIEYFVQWLYFLWLTHHFKLLINALNSLYRYDANVTIFDKKILSSRKNFNSTLYFFVLCCYNSHNGY